MFVKTTRSGPRTYLQIARAYRDPVTGKPKQEHIANLGRIDLLEDADIDGLINGLLKAKGRPALSEITKGVTSSNTIFSRGLELGDIWAVMELWRELKLAQAIQRQARSRSFQIDMEKLIRVMVVNRLSDPRSKLGILEWLEGVALPGIAKAEITHTSLLRAMDFLISQKSAVEKELASTLFPLFAREMEVVFYDITTVRAHGEGEEEGDLREYGKPKDGDTPVRQLAVGLVQTPEGLPITHEVFEGNVSEPKTLRGVVQGLVERFPIKRLIFVADRGMISYDNLDELEKTELCGGKQAEYIVAVPARRYREMTKDLATLHAQLIGESRRTKQQAIRETTVDGRRLVMAYSPTIAKRSRRQRSAKLVEACRLARSLGDKLNDQADGKRTRGRRLTDAGARVKLRDFLVESKLTRLIKIDWDAEVYVWDWDVEELKRELMLDGMLVLITNVPDMSAADLVARYKDLADIERAFRVLKSVLELAPMHHRLPDRIRAHTFICFLALVIERVMRFRLRKAGADLSPEKVLLQLKGIQSHRVKLVTGKELRGITTVTPQQRSLFEAIGVEVPTRKLAEAAV